MVGAAVRSDLSPHSDVRLVPSPKACGEQHFMLCLSHKCQDADSHTSVGFNTLEGRKGRFSSEPAASKR